MRLQDVYVSWKAWQLDAVTWGWIVWLAWFAVLETHALIVDAKHDALTAHLRPLFIEHPLTWFLAVGLWAWLGWHFLLEVGTPFRRY